MNSWSQLILPFGKYKGQSFYYIYQKDKSYIQWLASSPSMIELYKKAAADMLAGKEYNSPTGKKIVVDIKSNKPIIWPLDKNFCGVSFEFNHPLKDLFKLEVDSRTWEKEAKHWKISNNQLIRCVEVFGGVDKINWKNDAEKVYDAQIKKTQELAEIAKQEDAELETNLPLFGYQKVAVNFALKANGRIIIGDQMGIGKSLEAIAFAEFKKCKTLIVCPKSVVPTWIKELKKFLDKTACIWDSKEKIGHGNAQYHIIHYDAVPKQLDKLLDIDFDLLICDEASHLKNNKTIRAKSILGSWKERKKYPGIKTKYALMLTGTPILNRPTELFTLLNFLDKKQFSNFMAFTEKYGGWRGEPPKNTDDLHKRIQNLIIRRKFTDVYKDIPNKERIEIILELTPEELIEYNKYLQQMFSKWKKSGKVSVAEMPPIQAYLIKKKMPKIIEILDEFLENDRGALIFSNYVAPLKSLHEHYKNDSVLMYGDLNIAERQEAIQALIDKKAKFGFFTIGTGAMGIDGLQHVISDVINIDFSWVPAYHDQAEGRCFRRGQQNPVQSFYLIVKDTIDEYMKNLIWDKMKVISEVIDGETLLVDIQQSIFKEFINLLRNKYNNSF